MPFCVVTRGGKNMFAATINNIIQYHPMIDAIRNNGEADISIEKLRERLNIPRTAADKMFGSLIARDGGQAIINRNERRIAILNNIAYFFGISIGSQNIRMVLLGLNFKPVSREEIRKKYSELAHIEQLSLLNSNEMTDGFSYAYRVDETPEANRWENIRATVSAAVSCLLRQIDACVDDRQKFPLMGIGLGVAGPVDFEAKQWCSAPRLTEVRNICLSDLIGYSNQKRLSELGIFTSLDNNSKTAMISEYQYLVEQNNGDFVDDVALIYIGSGIGSAAVIDGHLLRGKCNLSGELGHILVAYNDDATLERKILQEGQPESSAECAETEQRIKDAFLAYIPTAINALNCILGIGKFILVGHNVAKCSWINDLMDQRLRFTVPSTAQFCSYEEGRGAPSTAAIGAAIESYFCMCNYAGNEKEGRMNLATNISWR